MGRKQGQISENQNLKGITMQVILPEEQVQEIQLLVSDVIKKEIQHFKEDIGLETPYLNKAQTCQYLFRSCAFRHMDMDIFLLVEIREASH